MRKIDLVMISDYSLFYLPYSAKNARESIHKHTEDMPKTIKRAGIFISKGLVFLMSQVKAKRALKVKNDFKLFLRKLHAPTRTTNKPQVKAKDSNNSYPLLCLNSSFLSKTSYFNQKGNRHNQKIVKYFIILSRFISKYTQVSTKIIGDNIINIYFKTFQTPTKVSIQAVAKASSMFYPLSNLGIL